MTISTLPSALPLMFLVLLPYKCHAVYEQQLNEGDEIMLPEVITRDETFIRSQTSMPARIKEMPLILHTSIQIESISEIQNNYAVFEIYLSETWKDTHFNEGEPISLSGPGINYFDWIPDTYFLLSKKTKYYSNTQAIHFNGHNVTLDRKVRITGSCTTHVWYFPFDAMRCTIIYSSYGFGNTEMVLKWTPAALNFPYSYQSTKELGYDIAGISNREYPTKYGTVWYCILEGSIYLKRIWSVHIIQSYLPATFLVLLSSTVFWISQQISGLPARASVGITSVLAMLTLCRRRTSPKDNISRNFSLLDTYLWVSFLFVSLAMLLFALGDFVRQKPDHSSRRRINNKSLDKTMRAVYPLSFLCFILLYWTYVYLFVLNAS